jgi:hypothetical protein
MLHDESLTRAKTEQLAYRLWQEAGCPEGQAERFWREAEAVIAARQAVPSPAPAEDLPVEDPAPARTGAPPPETPGWRAGLARYFAAWWAYPSKPASR